jgi:uncharacterized protein YciI
LVTVCCLASGLLALPASALASNSFSNSSIAEIAETYPEGSLQGQCIVFVANVLKQASGNTISLSAYAWGYQGTYPHFGGVQVSAAEATRGDIIQVTPPGSSDSQGAELDDGPLHTAIIRQNLGSGNFSVIDSNFAYDERVARHNVSLGSWAGDVVKIWRMGQVPGGGGGSGGGAVTNGSFVSYQGNVFRIAGGAPLYVSNWSVFGGAQPTQELSASEWEGLRSRPSDGTLLRSGTTVYVVAGGAPLVVSSCNAIGSCDGYVQVDPYDISHLDHLNAVPSNGTLVRAGVAVYAVAGGAPLAVTSCSEIGSCDGYVQVDPYAISHLDHLNPVPSNGTLLRAGVAVYTVAGGAPLAVSGCAAIGTCDGYVQVDPYDISHLDHLNAVPSNGTLLRAGVAVYTVAGGTLFAVSSCAVIGTCDGYVQVDPYDISHLDHLSAVPADGTLVEGLPSDTFWSFEGGFRSQVPADSTATGVDDVGLAAFPVRSASDDASSPSSTATGATSARTSAAAGQSRRRRPLRCHKQSGKKKGHGKTRCRRVKKHRRRHR